MKFNTWLKAQQNRNDPIGDLARDAFSDNSPLPTTKTEWIDMLNRYGACDEAIKALKQAYKEYETLTTPREICK